MVPSDLSVDLHRLDVGDNLSLDLRTTADAAFSDSPVRPTSVLVGGFMEAMLSPWIRILDLDGGTSSSWGDGTQPLDFTAISDAAAFTESIALDADTTGRTVAVAGEVRTMQQLHASVERATGRTLHARSLGSVDDLQAEIVRRKATATSLSDDLPLQYQWAMVSGKAKLRDLRNTDYPDVTPMSVEQFLSREGRTRSSSRRGTATTSTT